MQYYAKEICVSRVKALRQSEFGAGVLSLNSSAVLMIVRAGAVTRSCALRSL